MMFSVWFFLTAQLPISDHELFMTLFMGAGSLKMEIEMSKIAVITDSNAHITAAEAGELGIGVVPMPFMIGEETFYEGITLSREESRSSTFP